MNMSDSRQDGNNACQKLALVSVIAPLIAVALIYLVNKLALQDHQTLLIGVIIWCVLIAAGALSGIIALFGIIKYGTERILVPALLGVAFSYVLIVYVALPAFRNARTLAAAQASLHGPPAPVVHLQNAHLLN